MASATALKLFTIFEAIDKVTDPINKIESNVSKATAGMTSAVGKVGGSMNFLKSAATGALAVLGTGQLVSSVLQFSEAADVVAKTSRRIGTSVETYQELEHWAGLAGVSQEDLTTSMSKFTKNLGEAKMNGGSMIKTLADIDMGLARSVHGAKTTEQALSIMVEAIDKTKDPTKRMVLATAAFGKSGATMINAAEGGAKGLAELRKEARDLGKVMSTDTANSAELFNDTLARAQGAVRGLAILIIGPLLKSLQPVIEVFKEWMVANRELISGKINTFVTVLTTVLGNLFSIAFKVLGIIYNINEAFGGLLIPIILGGILAFKAITAAIVIYKAVLGAYTIIQTAATAAGGLFNLILAANPIGLIIIGIVALIAALVLLWNNLDTVIGWLKKLWEWYMIPYKALWNLIKAVLRFTGVLEPLKSAWKIFAKMLEPVTKLVSGLGEFLGLVDKVPGKIETSVNNSSENIGAIPIGSNTGLLESNSFTENKSIVDVNFGNTPPGTKISQTGNVPGVNLNLGSAK